MRAPRKSATDPTQLVIAETACQLRVRLRARQRFVSCTLNDYAGRRRGKIAADAMNVLADAMLDSGDTVHDVGTRFAQIGERIATSQLRHRAG